MSIKFIENTGLCMAECSEHGTVAAINRLGVPEKVHLYMVTITRDRIEGTTRLYPVVSIYYVIAQDGENACAQVKDNAFPEERFVSIERGNELKCVATRIPFHLRGWGNQTF